VKRDYKRWLILAAGWGFIVLGIIGLFLPILQGILFIAVGLILLSKEYAWAGDLIAKARERFPRITPHVDRAHDKVHSWFRKAPTEGDRSE
jgi:uncharacterized membrane protein YbaN (DUF454 family)